MTTTATDRLHRRAARGAARLDRTHPGWHTTIDLDRLNMACGLFDPDDNLGGLLEPDDKLAWCGCVGAQLDAAVDHHTEGSYGRFLNRQHIVNPVILGLSLPGDNDDPDAWDDLTAAWKAQITARRVLADVLADAWKAQITARPNVWDDLTDVLADVLADMLADDLQDRP